MPTLTETIADPDKRKAVVDDCLVMIESEVGDKSGLRGRAIKAAYKTVKGIKPGFVRQAMDDLLPPFSEKVDPYWIECQQQGAVPSSFFVTKKKEIANALLSITDVRADASEHRVLVKAYKGLRPMAVGHICDAMPRLGDLMAKHAS